MNEEMDNIVDVKFTAHLWSDGMERLLDEKKKLRDQFILNRKVEERLVISDRKDYTLYLKQIHSL